MSTFIMWRKLIAFLFLPVLFSFQKNNKPIQGFEITGYIEGLKEGDTVLGVVLGQGWDYDRTDTAYVKNGVFHLSGTVPGIARNYNVMFKEGAKYVHLNIKNGEQITLRCNTDIYKIDHGILDDYIQVEGSAYTFSMQRLLSAVFLYDRAIIDLNKYAKKIADSLGFDGKLLSGIYESKRQVDKSFVTEIFGKQPNELSNNFILANLFLVDFVQRSSEHSPIMAKKYRELSDEDKNSYFGKRLQAYARLSVGEIFPAFVFPGTDGKPIALKDILSKGKVTVVNFWGTNSPLTRNSHDGLRVMYKKYHDKGLNIIAVSSDDYIEAWKEFLDREKYPWYNVIDKKGVTVDTLYQEFTINPEKLRNVTNVVLDPNGKILAWDVEGMELHYYLWKQLGD